MMVIMLGFGGKYGSEKDLVFGKMFNFVGFLCLFFVVWFFRMREEGVLGFVEFRVRGVI